MRQYMTAMIGALSGGGGRWLPLAAMALVVLAMARPLVHTGDLPEPAGLAGRVLVMDMGAEPASIPELRLAAMQLLNEAPAIATGLVAVAGEAYTVVPLTTDRNHLSRYLRVLSTEAMPLPGRAVHAGWAEAERLLARSGLVAAQIVLLSVNEPPAVAPALPVSAHERVVLIADDSFSESWVDYAASYDAKASATGDADGLDDALLAAAAARARAEGLGGAIELAPWLIGGAMVCVLPLFRRRLGE